MSRATAWVGWIWFAALLIMASGVLNVMTGLVAVLGRDNAYVDTGVGLVLVGACLAAGQTWARVLAIVLVTLNLLTQFITLPAYPVWSIIVIAIDLIVIWALIVHGDEVRDI